MTENGGKQLAQATEETDGHRSECLLIMSVRVSATVL